MGDNLMNGEGIYINFHTHQFGMHGKEAAGHKKRPPEGGRL